METGRHVYLGDVTGNYSQPSGRHRENRMPKGVGLIPLGNRDRDRFEFGVDVIEERDSIDISTSRRR